MTATFSVQAADVLPLPAGEEGEAALDAVQILAGDSESAVGPAADGHQDGVMAGLQFGDSLGKVDILPAGKAYPHLFYRLQLPIEHRFRQPVGADTVAQQAAGLFLAFEHGDAVALFRQLGGGGDAGGAGADNGDLLLAGFSRLTTLAGRQSPAHPSGSAPQGNRPGSV